MVTAMKGPLSDDEIHVLGSRFRVQVREEASLLLWYIWQGISECPDLPACIRALVEDEDLNSALQAAHAIGKYDEIRYWHKSSLMCHGGADDAVLHNIHVFLDKLKPTMQRLIDGDIAFPVWTPSTCRESLEPEITAHLASLQIPCLKGKPNLLLHELGTFRNDVLLEQRLKNIFMPNNHTFLVNTSGSGKTRLLLEGLCENWGFYFTSLVDSSLLGSSDIQNSIQTHVPDTKGFRRVLPPAGSAGYDAALRANRGIASRAFRQIFLARLLIFSLFAETMRDFASGSVSSPENCCVYRARWLLLQLRPSFVHPEVWDIFDELSCKLSNATDAFINATTKTLLSNVRTLCSSLEPKEEGGGPPTLSPPSPSKKKKLSTSETSQLPFFCVLDEAQYAATQHSSSFRSDQDSGAHRPILREIVKAWEGQAAAVGQGVFMVVAGTGISKDVVDQAMASAIMKDSRYRWCSDTGAFDSRDVQVRYLRKYLPEPLLKSESGRRLIERVWYWLHGRYRFTSGYVAELLLDGFRRPHGLLNAYVEHFTNFKVTDATSFVTMERQDPLPVLSQYKLDFYKLKKNSDMLATIHQLTAHYLMRSVLPVALGKDEATYVEYGFARFVDSETKTVAVDEPLVLLAATHWINNHHRSTYKFFAKEIHLHDAASNGFENYIAFCIDMMFSSRRRICDVFTFVGGGKTARRPPAWSVQDAELVMLHTLDGVNPDGPIETSNVRHFQFSGPSVTLGANAKSPEETSRWLEHRGDPPSPICFPHSAMGPDLLFVLRLADGTLIWVVLQAKYSIGKNGSIPRLLLRQAIRSVTPAMFFLDKDGNHFSPTSHPNLITETRGRLSRLPNRRNGDAGRYGLLRVVASFPADPNLKRCLEEDPDVEGHPIATLNMNLVKQETRKMSPLEFLQNLERPLLNLGKRKRGTLAGSGLGEGSKKRLKIKLN